MCVSLSVQFFSFSCSFRQKVSQIIGYTPPQKKVGDPTPGNPGSATVFWSPQITIFLEFRIETSYGELRNPRLIYAFKAKDTLVNLESIYMVLI